MKVVCSSETLVNFYQTTRGHFPDAALAFTEWFISPHLRCKARFTQSSFRHSKSFFAFDCTRALKESFPKLERSLLFFSLLSFYSKETKHAKKPLRSTANSFPHESPLRAWWRRLSWQHCQSDERDVAKRTARQCEAGFWSCWLEMAVWIRGDMAPWDVVFQLTVKHWTNLLSVCACACDLCTVFYSVVVCLVECV